MSSTSSAIRISIPILVLATLALSGCSALAGIAGDKAPVRDEDSSEITAGGDLDVFTLKVGDCFDDTSGSTVTELPVVPCASAHDNEVFYELTLPAGEYPGDDGIDAAASPVCEAEFATFVGVTYDESALSFSDLRPTRESWEARDDRVVQCIVYDEQGKVTGSLRGTGR